MVQRKSNHRCTRTIRIFRINNNRNVTFINAVYFGNGGAIQSTNIETTITVINCTFINNTSLNTTNNTAVDGRVLQSIIMALQIFLVVILLIIMDVMVEQHIYTVRI
ncbi:hypothetical protein ALNOE001_03850 [Candidatus Methanobinarius endosymbioticus]|uniref:Uncharacterized protein n=1 Tax=Candidatus Methanobinarius endosymbioticus TaxID=2006182 RepID=A0A366MF05_9EURY|nr:hypothetical protein ALNOE001_03850 [Candidatus Methanobinarius endosymbioticus]